jgi:hypothetical protein
VKPCGNNQYCCFGLHGCDCKNNTQLFTLDPILSIISPEDRWGSSTIATSPSTNPTASKTSIVETTQPKDVNSSENTNNNLGVPLGLGLGIGVPLLLAIIATIWSLSRRRTTIASNQQEVSAGPD